MSIKKAGTVVVMEDDVTVTGFEFEGVTLEEAKWEALVWAKNRLKEAAAREKHYL